MCGICGVFQRAVGAAPAISDQRLATMTELIRHRGPDDRGFYRAPGVAFGVRRLSIVDVDGGHQPMPNESGEIWAMQNGELFNHLELRRSLERDGHVLRTRCDTEVIPHLYERYGSMFPTKLRGMFGIAVWDARSHTGILARDRLGIKPLYYAETDSAVVFGSELKCVMASGLVDAELDFSAIDAYLTLGFFPGPMTPMDGVSKLMPGHVLVITPEGVRQEQYWEYPKPDVGERLSDEEYQATLATKLDESVRLRLMSDVPLGAMLSGGLDSSLIVAMMARHMSEPVKTFSVGFEGSGATSELADARLVADYFSTEHHELELSFTDTVDLDELVWYMDEPLADLSSLGFIALCQLATRHVKVALSGQGADELFGGYAKHRAAAMAGHWSRVPGPVRRGAGIVLGRAPARFDRPARTLAATNDVDRLLAMSGKLDDRLRLELLRGRLTGLQGEAAADAVRKRLGDVDEDPLSATLHIDGQLALVDDMLHYFDRASMAHSLEVRVPFLDHELVEYAARIPADLKVHRFESKYILKQVARGLLPDRAIDKPKLGFFHESVGGWLQAQAHHAIQEYLLVDDPHVAEFVDMDAVRRLTLNSASEAEQHILLAILMLEIWLSTYLSRVRSAVAAGERAGPVPLSQ